MQRHPYEWTSLAENRWPHDGRKLTRNRRAKGKAQVYP